MATVKVRTYRGAFQLAIVDDAPEDVVMCPKQHKLRVLPGYRVGDYGLCPICNRYIIMTAANPALIQYFPVRL